VKEKPKDKDETKQRKVDLVELKKDNRILEIDSEIQISNAEKQKVFQSKKNAAAARFWETYLPYGVANLTVVPVVIDVLADNGLLPAALANMPALLKVFMPAINGLAIPVVFTGVEYGLRKTLGFEKHPRLLNKKREIHNAVPMVVPVVNWFFPTLSVREAKAYVVLAVAAQTLFAVLDVKAPDSPEAAGMGNIYSQWQNILFFQIFLILLFSRSPAALKSVGETAWSALSHTVWKGTCRYVKLDAVSDDTTKQLLEDADANDFKV